MDALITVKTKSRDLDVEISINAKLDDLPEILEKIRLFAHGELPQAESNGTAREALVEELRSTYVALRRIGAIHESCAPTRTKIAVMSTRELAELLEDWRRKLETEMK